MMMTAWLAAYLSVALGSNSGFSSQTVEQAGAAALAQITSVNTIGWIVGEGCKHETSLTSLTPIRARLRMAEEQHPFSTVTIPTGQITASKQQPKWSHLLGRAKQVDRNEDSAATLPEILRKEYHAKKDKCLR